MRNNVVGIDTNRMRESIVNILALVVLLSMAGGCSSDPLQLSFELQAADGSAIEQFEVAIMPGQPRLDGSFAYPSSDGVKYTIYPEPVFFSVETVSEFPTFYEGAIALDFAGSEHTVIVRVDGSTFTGELRNESLMGKLAILMRIREDGSVDVRASPTNRKSLIQW